MVFVDTNVLMYAVGGEHPLRSEARDFFLESAEEGRPLATSAEVLQELLHAYLPVRRTGTLDAALRLAEGRIGTVWSVEEEDVRHARRLADRHPALGARDVLHLACCRRRDVTRAKTFDRALASAFG
jgi:predicted nucleic acid-binding protein